MNSDSLSQAQIVASLPQHLRPFVAVQDPKSQYTARDHAVWRFLMTALTRGLKDTAHPVYLEGLARTGIALDHIPSIDEMNICLAKLGWRAVVVDGFIPPAIFMEFQALKVLVIALEMRSIEHLLYTPAPDILHESAGHAPFLIDVDYAEFLQRFGEVGMQAIASQHDHELYEAVRELSILKESPDTSAADIAEAEARLTALAEADQSPSEAALLTRLHWWTVEYGLVGEIKDYRLFGAGLLSSLGESQSCKDDARVHKIPLTVNAVNTAYDITSTQPQLFVTKSCAHMSQVLEEFAATMAAHRGGAESLHKAIASKVVCTAEYDSGVQVSGVLSDLVCDAVGNVNYLQTQGPTQLAWRGTELYGHGIDSHKEGFGSPVGRLTGFSRCLSQYTVDELKAHRIVLGEVVLLEFLSGISVRGKLDSVLRQEHRNLLFSFSDCTVTALDGRVLFDPAWGRYDMAVGGSIPSVYGGVADRENYQLYKPVPRTTALAQQVDPGLLSVYDLLSRVCDGDVGVTSTDLHLIANALQDHPNEWLLRAEILRGGAQLIGEPLAAQVHAELDALVMGDQHRRALTLVFPEHF